MTSPVEDRGAGVAIHGDGKWARYQVNSLYAQIKHQEVTDGAGNKKEGRKYLEWKNEAMKNFTAETTLGLWKITVEVVNDPILFICLQKGRQLEDNSSV